MERNLNFLDCTFRDGGYYNNWSFSKQLINKYLKILSLLNINYSEIGFRSNSELGLRGTTAYTSDKFINSLSIPNNINPGVMINASDIVGSNTTEEKFWKNLFPGKTKVKFVRLACHFNEIFKIKKSIKWLKSKNFLVTINIMQISEIKDMEIKKVCKFLKSTKTDIIYLADSLGCLKPHQVQKILNKFKKHWDRELGIHAHNNLNLALKNSLAANKNGVKWIDGTMLGMGRGPGNVKTEEFIKNTYKDRKKIDTINSFIKKYFIPLKSKYKWGPNRYYTFSAKYKIHPTFVQEMISRKKYKQKDYFKILNNLKKADSKKFNPYKLYLRDKFYRGKPKGTWNPKELLSGREVLIVGGGKSTSKYSDKIISTVRRKNLFIINLNTAKLEQQNVNNFRAFCHPMRILSDKFYYKDTNDKIIMPFSMFSKKLKKKLQIKKENLLDYGLALHSKKNIVIKKNYCILPKPLVVAYTLSMCLAGNVKKIYVAGLDGFDKTDPSNDDTNLIISLIKKNYKKFKIQSITPTNFKIN